MSSNNNMSEKFSEMKLATTPPVKLVEPTPPGAPKKKGYDECDYMMTQFGLRRKACPVRRIPLSQKLKDTLQATFNGLHLEVLDSVLEKLYELGIDNYGPLTDKKANVLAKTFKTKANDKVYNYDVGLYTCHECTSDTCFQASMLTGWDLYGNIELGVALRILIAKDYNFSYEPIDFQLN